MKKKNSFLCAVITLMMIGLLVGTAGAQDGGSPSFEAYEKDPAEQAFFTRGDSSDFAAFGKKDSSTLRKPLKRNVYKPAPVVPKEKDQPSDADDNSVLSFNFLYYLIQKYKMQDIVD